MMKTNKTTIKSEFRNVLKKYHKEIHVLSKEARSNGLEVAKQYYLYLEKCGVSYAKLALDVVESRGKFGKLANIHLKSQSIFEGVKVELFDEMREKIIISLASHDSKMRSSKGYKEYDTCYELIEKYHLKVFNCHTSVYAWGGLIMKEIAGNGSWMKSYENGENIFQEALKLLENVQSNYDSKYSIERMLQSVIHTFKIYSLGIEIPFVLQMSTGSIEQASMIWKKDVSCIEEIKEETSLSESMMAPSRVFRIKAASSFVKGGDDYSSSEDEDNSSEILLGNKIINQRLSELLQDPLKLKKYQEEQLNQTIEELKITDSFIPNFSQASINFANEYKDLFQQFTQINNKTEIAEKLEKANEDLEEQTPNIQNLIESFGNNQNFTPNNSEQVFEDQNAWANEIVFGTMNMMNNLQNNPEMQEFMQMFLGNNSNMFNDQI